MQRNGFRYCELCDREIKTGERYSAALIEREQIPTELNVATTGFTADALGNLQIDICLECRSSVSLSGEEAIC